jgi:hypothetical protein
MTRFYRQLEKLLKAEEKKKAATATDRGQRKSPYRMGMLMVVLHLLEPKARS